MCVCVSLHSCGSAQASDSRTRRGRPGNPSRCPEMWCRLAPGRKTCYGSFSGMDNCWPEQASVKTALKVWHGQIYSCPLKFTHTVCTTYSTCFKWLTHRCYLWSNCNHVSVMLLALQRYEHTEVLKNMWSLVPQLNISECHCFKLQEVNTNAAGGCCCHFCSTSLSQFSSNVLMGQFQYKFQ